MTKNEFDRLVRFFKTHSDYNHGSGSVQIHPPMAKKLGMILGHAILVVNTYTETKVVWQKDGNAQITPFSEKALPIDRIIQGEHIMVSLGWDKDGKSTKIIPVHYKHILSVRLWLGFGNNDKRSVYF